MKKIPFLGDEQIKSKPTPELKEFQDMNQLFQQ